MVEAALFQLIPGFSAANVTELERHLQQIWAFGANIIVGWQIGALGLKVLYLPSYALAKAAQIRPDLLSGDPSTPHYAAAYEHYSRPKNSIDAQTGQMTSVTPDMSSIRRPTYKGPAPAPGAGPKVARKPVAPPKLSDAQSKEIGRAHV